MSANREREAIAWGDRAFHPADPSTDAGSVLRNYPLTSRIALSVSALTIVLLVLMAVPASRDAIQRMDDAVLSFMVRARWTPIVWVGQVFNVVGGAAVTVPLRAGMAVWLGVKRQWWFLATFGVAEIASELLNTYLKNAYDRARPPGGLVHTSGASFPSGHAVAASVIALILVMLLVPPGPRRRHWWIGAIAFTLFMAVSRAYLRAHWLSDAVGGVLVGSSCALDAALAIQAIRDHRERRALAKTPAVPKGAAEAMPAPGPLETKAEGD